MLHCMCHRAVWGASEEGAVGKSAGSSKAGEVLGITLQKGGETASGKAASVPGARDAERPRPQRSVAGRPGHRGRRAWGRRSGVPEDAPVLCGHRVQRVSVGARPAPRTPRPGLGEPRAKGAAAGVCGDPCAVAAWRAVAVAVALAPAWRAGRPPLERRPPQPPGRPALGPPRSRAAPPASAPRMSRRRRGPRVPALTAFRSSTPSSASCSSDTKRVVSSPRLFSCRLLPPAAAPSCGGPAPAGSAAAIAPRPACSGRSRGPAQPERQRARGGTADAATPAGTRV